MLSDIEEKQNIVRIHTFTTAVTVHDVNRHNLPQDSRLFAVQDNDLPVWLRCKNDADLCYCKNLFIFSVLDSPSEMIVTVEEIKCQDEIMRGPGVSSHD